MSYQVQISEKAERDLFDIYAHIGHDLQAMQTAIAQLERIEKQILALDEKPERFRLVDFEPWRSCGLRVVPIDNFVVFYLLDNERSVVSVVRVMYGGRDRESELTV